MSAADDEEEFGARLAGELPLVATVDGRPLGFASLADNKRIDMIYVHPIAAGQGAAAMLCDALEKLAAARGAKELTVDASDTARGFFEKRGFLPRPATPYRWLASGSPIPRWSGRLPRRSPTEESYHETR